MPRQSQYRPPLPTESRASRVYDTLRKGILSGRLAQGTRLRETELARSLRVSRTPVREALRRFQAEGLVEVLPGRGMVVSELTTDAILELYIVRIALEGTAARLAAHLMTPLELERLQRVQRELEQAVAAPDPKTLAALNTRFHQQICAAGKNRYLLEFAQRIYDALRRFKETTLTYPGRAQEMLVEHRMILEAFEARDGERAEALAREHMRKAMQCRIAMTA